MILRAHKFVQQCVVFLSLFSCNFNDQLSLNFHRFVILCICWAQVRILVFDNYQTCQCLSVEVNTLRTKVKLFNIWTEVNSLPSQTGQHCPALCNGWAHTLEHSMAAQNTWVFWNVTYHYHQSNKIKFWLNFTTKRRWFRVKLYSVCLRLSYD